MKKYKNKIIKYLNASRFESRHGAINANLFLKTQRFAVGFVDGGNSSPSVKIVSFLFNSTSYQKIVTRIGSHHPGNSHSTVCSAIIMMASCNFHNKPTTQYETKIHPLFHS